MPFCPKCGKEISSEATYCYYCGESLPKVQSVPAEKAPEAPTIKKEVPPPPKTHKTRNIAIIALVLIVVIAFVAVHYSGTIFNMYAQTQEQISLQGYQIVQNSPDYVSVTVKNVGTKNLTITNAYIDLKQATISGSLSLGIGQTTTFTAIPWNTQNIRDGATHSLMIEASDGTAVVWSELYNIHS